MLAPLPVPVALHRLAEVMTPDGWVTTLGDAPERCLTDVVTGSAGVVLAVDSGVARVLQARFPAQAPRIQDTARALGAGRGPRHAPVQRTATLGRGGGHGRAHIRAPGEGGGVAAVDSPRTLFDLIEIFDAVGVRIKDLPIKAEKVYLALEDSKNKT